MRKKVPRGCGSREPWVAWMTVTLKAGESRSSKILKGFLRFLGHQVKDGRDKGYAGLTKAQAS